MASKTLLPNTIPPALNTSLPSASVDQSPQIPRSDFHNHLVLSGPVRPDDGQNVPRVHFLVNPGKGGNPTEMQGQTVDDKLGHHSNTSLRSLCFSELLFNLGKGESFLMMKNHLHLNN
jgi:hypothetical protein